MATFFCKPWNNRGQGHQKMGRGPKLKPQPQATLTCSGSGPPILDPSPCKPQDTPRRNTSWPAQMLHHLTNMIASPQPVYWVEQQMPQYQAMPYTVMDQGGGLWHHAPPGGIQQQQMMEPLQMLEAYTMVPSGKMQVPVYTTGCPAPKVPSKPLNPDAQEWVPQEYRKAPAAMPTPPAGKCMGKVPHSPLIPNGYLDFCEITEKEVEEARINGYGSPYAYGTEGVEKCQDPVPQWTPTNKCDQFEEVTPCLTTSAPRSVESERIGASQCLEPTLAGDVRVESQVQSSQSPESPIVMPQKDENGSPLCVTCFSPEEKMSSSLEQVSESQQSPCSTEKDTSPTTVHLRPTSPATSGRHARQDQDQCSAETLAERLGPGLIKTNGESVALLNQRNSSHTSPPQAANSPSEGHRLSPGSSLSVKASLEVPSSPQCPENATGITASVTYAGVVGRASPSPPPPVEFPDKYKGVEQPLPRIFQRDVTPPRKAEVQKVQGERAAAELFRRPSKTQRTRSRKFLMELKKSSENGGVARPSSPSPSSASDLSDLSQSPDDLFSPPRFAPCLAVSPPTKAISPPQAIPTSALLPSLAESPSGRTRSSSESSTASLDIEFVEQDEVDRAATERTPPIKGRGGLGSGNGFLACILGSGDSDSESEDESDLDWDEVCDEDVAPGLDDSWETFGFGLVVVECQMSPVQGQHTPAQATKTQESSGDSFLKDVNKRWEEEVGKDVRGRSRPRVTFGGEKVHRMVVWGHAYREARRGPWEQQARDRARFAQRVATLEPTLSQVLDHGHRRAVYHRLYAPPPPRCFL